MQKEFGTLIALRVPLRFTGSELSAKLTQLFPAVTFDIELPSGPDTQPTLVTVNGIDLTIMTLDYPMPDGTMGQAVEHNFMWPQAGAELAGHKAHAFIQAENSVGEGREGAISCAAVLTYVTAAICSLGPAVGVSWTSSANLWPAEHFLASAALLGSGKQLPIELWVRGYVDYNPQQKKASAATRGLAAFIEREIEVDYCSLQPDHVFAFAMRTSHYLAQNGPVFALNDNCNDEDSGTRFRVSERGQGLLIPIPLPQARTRKAMRYQSSTVLSP